MGQGDGALGMLCSVWVFHLVNKGTFPSCRKMVKDIQEMRGITMDEAALDKFTSTSAA